MPSTSKKQHDAMKAAAAGKSNLGIPKSVGKEYVEADRKKGKYQGSKKGKRTKR